LLVVVCSLAEAGMLAKRYSSNSGSTSRSLIR
jgi:hypothetical protein